MIKKQAIIPDYSILKKDEKSFHYIDSFQGQYLITDHDYTIIEIGRLFLTSGPKWANYLMSIRDKVVGILGLKTAQQLTVDDRNHDNFRFEPGEQLDIFKLFSKSENELVLGDDDKHLNFRVSLLLDSNSNNKNKGNVIITTVVKYRNLFGRIYFIPVRPIHKLIVKGTLKEMIKKIENVANE
jgi:hypothetical protein